MGVPTKDISNACRLFANDLSGIAADTYYRYLYANQSQRKDLILNNNSLLTQCVDYYFEGAEAHVKVVDLLKECLNERQELQELSEKEKVFLEAIEQENISFAEMSDFEVKAMGVKSWTHYRYLRQKSSSSIQHVLDHLLSTDQLFRGFSHWKDAQAFCEACACIQKDRGLAKVIQQKDWPLFVNQLTDLNYRPRLRAFVFANPNYKFIHLKNEIIRYEEKRRLKNGYTHTKKTSCTLLSSQLNTPLFGDHHDASSHPLVGLLFDQEECKVKARLLKDSGTYRHEWIGDKNRIDRYKEKIKGINKINESSFVEEIKNSPLVNEVLAKVNNDGLRAILIGRDIPEARCLAILRRNELRDKFSIDLPMMFYSSSTRSIRHYTLEEQANDMPKPNREFLLEIYKTCSEKGIWNLGFLTSSSRIEKKSIPRTISYIKQLVEDALLEEQNLVADSSDKDIWLEVKEKVKTVLNKNCNESALLQFFKGRSNTTQAFYQDLQNQLSQTKNSQQRVRI